MSGEAGHVFVAPLTPRNFKEVQMNYWLDLFTGTTWREFREAGANVSGFRPRQVKTAKKMQPGDVFLCYLTGVMRWVGALEIIGPSSDAREIWKEQNFPVRFAVKPLVRLDPEHGVPMQELEGRVKFYTGAKDCTAAVFLPGQPILIRKKCRCVHSAVAWHKLIFGLP